MRTIELHLTQERADSLCEKGISRVVLNKAIGYLSSWGISYPEVSVAVHSDGEISALYYDADGFCRFSIHAIWRGEEYTFHS